MQDHVFVVCQPYDRCDSVRCFSHWREINGLRLRHRIPVASKASSLAILQDGLKHVVCEGMSAKRRSISQQLVHQLGGNGSSRKLQKSAKDSTGKRMLGSLARSINPPATLATVVSCGCVRGTLSRPTHKPRGCVQRIAVYSTLFACCGPSRVQATLLSGSGATSKQELGRLAWCL